MMVTAFVLMTTKRGREKEIVDALRTEKEINSVFLSYGDYDIVAKVEAKSLDKLNNFILNNLRAIDNINAINTLIKL